jgi:hypothetical protein
MAKPLWISDPEQWDKLPLTEQAEELRKHYCMGPCGQSLSVLATRQETDRFFKRVIKELQSCDSDCAS